MNVYLRTQAVVLADIKNRLRDTANARWSDAEVYRAINRALETWTGRVSIPALYTFTMTAGVSEYTLPSYIDPDRYNVQAHEWLGVDESDLATATQPAWLDVPSSVTDPSATGALTLRIQTPVYSTSGRIIYWTRSSPVPTTVPTSTAEISATATSVTAGAAVDVGETGWVYINAEWIQYSGTARGASTTTLSNLVRAQNNTTAAIHLITQSMYWGIGVNDLALYEQLSNQACAYLHEMYLTSGAQKERDLHVQMVSYYQQRADAYWRRYVPARSPRIRPEVSIGRSYAQ
jgi:hypothetical protein